MVVIVDRVFRAAVGAVVAVAVERGFAEQVGAGAGDDFQAVGFQPCGDGGDAGEAEKQSEGFQLIQLLYIRRVVDSSCSER